MKQQSTSILRAAAIILLACVLVIPTFAQGVSAGPGSAPFAGSGFGPGPGVAPGTCPLCPGVSTEPATAAEIQWLKFMREEEKLARDVYRFLYQKWNISVFDRIAASEERHFQTVGTLLTRYRIDDPAAQDVPGVFADQRLTALYAELTAKGAASLKDALEVGITIEKVDIDDLSKALLETTKWDLKRAYANLSAASLTHLDTFESYLEIALAQ